MPSAPVISPPNERLQDTAWVEDMLSRCFKLLAVTDICHPTLKRHVCLVWFVSRTLNMWDYMIAPQLFFSDCLRKLTKYTKYTTLLLPPSPFTHPFSTSSNHALPSLQFAMLRGCRWCSTRCSATFRSKRASRHQSSLPSREHIWHLSQSCFVEADFVERVLFLYYK